MTIMPLLTLTKLIGVVVPSISQIIVVIESSSKNFLVIYGPFYGYMKIYILLKTGVFLKDLRPQ
jgi:hypothetical protein